MKLKLRITKADKQRILLILIVGKEIWGESLNSGFGRTAIAKCLQIKRGLFFLVKRCCTSAGRCCLHVCIHLAKFVLCLQWNERPGYWSIVSSPVTNIESNLQINFCGRISENAVGTSFVPR